MKRWLCQKLKQALFSFKMAVKHLTGAKLIEFIYLWKKLQLTLYSKNDSLADWRRHPVGCNAQVRTHVQATDSYNVQNFAVHNVNWKPTDRSLSAPSTCHPMNTVKWYTELSYYRFGTATSIRALAFVFMSCICLYIQIYIHLMDRVIRNK